MLSIIIPTFNNTQAKLDLFIQNIKNNFLKYNFNDYEIIVCHSGHKNIKKNESYNLINFVEKKYPGEARNIGLHYAKGEWIWFIDDDDILNEENLNDLFILVKENQHDLIVHSLKRNYANSKDDLIKNISLFKEKQEIFNFIVKKDLLKNNNIIFSTGLHEDIRYFLEVLIYSINLKILNKQCYIKIKNKNSITDKLSLERIQGYINALEEILKLNNNFIKNNQEKITIQTFGTILYLINSCEDANKKIFIEYTKNKLINDFNFQKFELNEKDTNFKFAVSILFIENIDLIIEKLKYCFSSHISCKDLKSSLFLGPNKIVGCCKRFFYEGKKKGDIILMPAGEKTTFNDVQDRKNKIEKLLNEDSFEGCIGCPYIERYANDEKHKIDYISFEDFTYCNMKCNYCSPTYYGGKKSEYDTLKIIKEIVNLDLISNHAHAVWGGGEPTLNPYFKDVTEKLVSQNEISKIRILSNSLKYSHDVENFLKNNKINLVTSIDAGTQQTFNLVRGKGEILQVFNNLKKYNDNQKNSEKITIKYIFTKDNYMSNEINNFVSLLKDFNFENSYIQISCNFNYEIPEKDIIFSFYEMAGLLFKEGFKYVYFDDLIRDRLKLNQEIKCLILDMLNSKNLLSESFLYEKIKKDIILWGNGYQAKWITTKTNFGKSNGILKIVNNEKDIINLNLNKDNLIICPAGIQSIPEICKEIKKSVFKDNLQFKIFI